MRGAFRSEPEFLLIYSSLHSEYVSSRANIPSSPSQVKCEVPSDQDQNSWRFPPVEMRGVRRSEPKFLAVFTSLNAGRFSVSAANPSSFSQFECEAFSVRTKIPCEISLFGREAFFGQNRNPRRRIPILMRGVCWSEPKFLAVFTSLNATRFSVRARIPGDISQVGCEVSVGQNRNS